ncbi:hypothetical protein SERLA73DRAFT_184085 [Serpula lacrymans var. lacrymans S7.3]|uniref:Uncharacterized protein n=2 Tax=Serpula lacrymans var. lacrymans TaxID=341189 RepID=F8Q2H9_SERL3|nr:uncharacterized protein SERLADRAFT_471578 [Serpula lacrymans var. lacrymans S7.9]EGN97390.1 hypothetical protein SERLA73DRAFT_184085 [Serpula lacrymans var. lacrymans S7.3]EGO22981.1 hypothetical protein SERLADRAFT_471578 [Serpula lacrymans var. lacrymans S7.9]
MVIRNCGTEAVTSYKSVFGTTSKYAGNIGRSNSKSLMYVRKREYRPLVLDHEMRGGILRAKTNDSGAGTSNVKSQKLVISMQASSGVLLLPHAGQL